MRLVWGSVTSVISSAEGIQLLGVDLDDGSSGSAVGYPALSGGCSLGDRVLLNTTAVDLSLGTGGRHFVVAREGERAGVQLDAPSGGHVMKLRYSPLQRDVLAVESPESPHHNAMRFAEDLGGLPVVCCGLHSQVPLVAAAVKAVAPTMRVAYCMTDGAALLLPLSDIIHASVSAGLIDTTVTCSQALGGDLEAVNLHSGLLAARHVAEADVAIVAIGPGVVGTATPMGHGGIAQGEALNAAGVLGGLPIAALRMSFADSRERHRVISHHSIAALTRIALVSATVAVPKLPHTLAEQVERLLEDSGIAARHRCATPGDGCPGFPDLRGVRVTTMGRGPEEDPAFFQAAFAAGFTAAGFAPGPTAPDSTAAGPAS
ncbi:MAG: DUF3866 family protein [Coriobacteriia bacterium]